MPELNQLINGNDTLIHFKTEETAKGFPMITVSVQSQLEWSNREDAKRFVDDLMDVYDYTHSKLEERRQ